MNAVRRGLFATLLLLISPVFSPAQSNEDCLACHGQPGLTKQKKGQEIQLYVNNDIYRKTIHGALGCVDCHQGFNAAAIPHARVINPVDCKTCHDTGPYDQSIHAAALGAAGCIECHGKHDILSAQNPDSGTNRNHVLGTCGRCHKLEDEHYSRSSHGTALAAGAASAPSCVDCHGAHPIVPVADPESVVYKTKEPAVCLKCHLDDAQVRRQVGVAAGFIAGYEESIHGVMLKAGNLNAPTCSSCHGAHDMALGSSANSLVGKFKVPETCGACHGEIVKVFNESAHGNALRAGNQRAPNCTDCHGEHQIFAPTDPRSLVSGKNVSARVCAECHNSVMLTQKYGLASERFGSFEDSYHGLASRGGSVAVANCASCHGYHNIKPSSDPTSTISKANLPATCSKCHPGANENFTKGEVHLVIQPETEPVLYWIRSIYTWLILLTIGGMLAHNVADFIDKSRFRFAMRRGLIEMEHAATNQYLRMSFNERLQHATLALSFITLVITGFMLRFPDAWWVTPIRRWSEWVFSIRGLVHRIAGVVMIAISIYHLYYVIAVPRGRQLIRDLVPKVPDAREFWGMFKYYTRISKQKPQFGRFSYIEKAEYWALIWGVIVMGGTGIILWFNNYFMGVLTLLGWNIAETIHYYEAWLATLAILVWHFYFVIFNPSVYPLNTACIRGTLTEEEMAEEHPRELEELRAAELQSETDTLKA